MRSIAEEILVEDKLKELFATLPDVVWTNPQTDLQETFTPIFQWGNEMDFNEFIKQENVFNPIIWLDTDYSEEGSEEGLDIDIDLIIPILTASSGMFNEERLDLSFRNILQPLLQNVLKAIKRSNTFILLDNNYKAKKFYNFGVREVRSIKDKQYISVPVESYKLSLSLRVFNYCLRPINYG